MSPIAYTAAIIAVVVVLFIWNRLPVVVVAMATAMALWATGVLTIGQALGGFGDPAVIFIASLFVVSSGLEVTGVTAWAGQGLIRGAGEEGRFLALQSGGFVIAEHVRKLDEPARDFVDVALGFRGTPYLWGGRTSLGVDCSGLVQLASEAAGLSCPRDADMQANEVGRQLDWQRADTLAHGDLVFWDGHVGIMTSAQDLVHASAYQMMVVEEPLAEARARIASSKGGEITGVRRPAGLSSAGLTSPR